MEPSGVACTHCGKNMTTDDLRRTACVHCGQVLAHHARAAQQVAVINQMMVDRNGNGIPDAFEGLVANAQANPYGAAPYPAPPPNAAHAAMAQANAMNQVHKRAWTPATGAILVIGIFVLAIALAVVGAGVAFVLIRH